MSRPGYGAEYRAKNKRKVHGWKIRSKYGLTADDYDRMLMSQDGVCKICKTAPGQRKLCVDHNHQTLKNRALLCDKCNILVSWIENKSYRFPGDEVFRSYLLLHN